MFRRILILVAAALCVGTLAHAQNPRKLLSQANKLFAEGRYAEALDVFQKGFEKAPKSGVFLRSMAYCKLKLLKHEEANKLFKQYLKEFPKAKDFDKIASTSKDLDVVVATRVTVTSEPSGATLFFDAAASKAVGKTPYTDKPIPPGKHLAIVKMPGYDTTRMPFEIPAKAKKTIHVPLKVGLEITSVPSGASLHLGSADSPSLGKTPLRVGVVPGNRKFFFTLEGYKTAVQAVQVSNSTKSVTSNLQLGIAVTSTPPGAEVEIDGVKRGETPLEDEATPGKHRVLVRMAGFRDYTQDIVVSPGSSNKVEAALQGGLLTMRTGPDGATVKVGGLALGTTPFDRASVPMGEQVVTVKHADRRIWRRALSFNDNELVTASVKLGRPSWPAWTAAGVAVASFVVGVAAGLAAKSKVDEADGKGWDDEGENPDGPNYGVCTDNGEPVEGLPDSVSADCGYGIHHVSTAGFVVGGVATAFSVLYYLLFVRPSETISRHPINLSLR